MNEDFEADELEELEDELLPVDDEFLLIFLAHRDIACSTLAASPSLKPKLREKDESDDDELDDDPDEIDGAGSCGAWACGFGDGGSPR